MIGTANHISLFRKSFLHTIEKYTLLLVNAQHNQHRRRPGWVASLRYTEEFFVVPRGMSQQGLGWWVVG